MLVSAVSQGVLMTAIKNPTQSERQAERKGSVAQIRDVDSNEVYGYNFFELDSLLDLSQSGAITLSSDQVSQLNQIIEEAGFDVFLKEDSRPKFVVGHVRECEPMEGSDHLKITQTEVDQGEVLQIVCGAKNIQAGQKVVVAKEGAIMPDGLVIWAGQLHKAKSYGMICSARELGIESTQNKGILVLEDDAQVGEAFQF